MKRVTACLLLICLGFLVPAGGASLRVCLVRDGSAAGDVHAAAAAGGCCDHCNKGDRNAPDPCCVDLEKLPDATAPQQTLVLPGAMPYEAGPSPWMMDCAWECVIHKTDIIPLVRGPDRSVLPREMLSVWRL